MRLFGNHRGFSLLELLVASGIAVLLTIGVATLVYKSLHKQQESQIKTTMNELKQKIVLNIQDPRAWSITILKNQYEFNCLAKNSYYRCQDPSQHSYFNHPISVYKFRSGLGGTLAVSQSEIVDNEDQIVPKIYNLGPGGGSPFGYTLTGARCNSFPSNDCRIQAQVVWRASCTSYPCDGDEAQDSLDINFIIANKTNFPNAGINEDVAFDYQGFSIKNFLRVHSSILSSDIYNNIIQGRTYDTPMGQVYFNPAGAASITNMAASTEFCLANGRWYYPSGLYDQQVPPVFWPADSNGCVDYRALVGPKGDSLTTTSVAPGVFNCSPATQTQTANVSGQCLWNNIYTCAGGTTPYSVISYTNNADPDWLVSINPTTGATSIRAPEGTNTVTFGDSASATSSVQTVCLPYSATTTSTSSTTTTTIASALRVTPASGSRNTSGTSCNHVPFPVISGGTPPYNLVSLTNSADSNWNVTVSGTQLRILGSPVGANTITVGDSASATATFNMTCTYSATTTTTVAPTCSATHNNNIGSGNTTASFTVTEPQSANITNSITSSLPNTNIWSYGTNNGVQFGPPYPFFVGTTDASGNYTWLPCATGPGGICLAGTYDRYFELKNLGTDSALCTTNSHTTTVVTTTTTTIPLPPLIITPPSRSDTADASHVCAIGMMNRSVITGGTLPYSIQSYTNSGDPRWNSVAVVLSVGYQIQVLGAPEGTNTITVRDAVGATGTFTYTCLPPGPTTTACTPLNSQCNCVNLQMTQYDTCGNQIYGPAYGGLLCLNVCASGGSCPFSDLACCTGIVTDSTFAGHCIQDGRNGMQYLYSGGFGPCKVCN